MPKQKQEKSVHISYRQILFRLESFSIFSPNFIVVKIVFHK